MNKKDHVFELRKFVSPEIVWGTDARLLIGQYIGNFESENPMIVTDRDVSKQGWFKDILDVAAARVSRYTVFDQVTPNPKDTETMLGAEIFLKNKCDLIIAVGGGSPMDCAKGISVLSMNGGHILDYEGVDKVREPGPPLICIPTTAGSSADVSQFAIILDTEHFIKKAIISKKVVPDLALIDPVPLMTTDAYLTACTGMDALTHAIEAYVSNAHSDLTDVHALEAIRLIGGSLEQLHASEKSIERIYPVMLGSLQAGLAFSNASLGAVHAMAHSLGGLLGIAHGECNSILLGPVVAENFDAAADRYTDIAEALGIDVSGRGRMQVKTLLVERIRALRQTLGIRETVRAGRYSDIESALIENALKDPCMVTNPKIFTDREVREIYEEIITVG
jgi:alcohol dehydrogenase class IV